MFGLPMRAFTPFDAGGSWAGVAGVLSFVGQQPSKALPRRKDLWLKPNRSESRLPHHRSIHGVEVTAHTILVPRDTIGQNSWVKQPRAPGRLNFTCGGIPPGRVTAHH